MVEPDILIDSNRTGILGRLEVAMGEESEPDAQLIPNSSTLRLGGGGGEYSDGDLRLIDRPGDVRIHASAGIGAEDPKTTRIFADGPSGGLQLGANGLQSEETDEEYDLTDIKLDPNIAGVRLGGGGGEHSEGDLRMRSKEGNVRIHASAGTGSVDAQTTRIFAYGPAGRIQLGADGLQSEDNDEGYDKTDIDLNPNIAGVRLGGGGGEYSEGDLRMANKEGDVRIHASAGGGARDPETTSIFADGTEGSMHFRPVKAGDALTHPMLYMFSGPTNGGPRDWTSDEFPQQRPILAHDPDNPATGLLWDPDNWQFVFQQRSIEDPLHGTFVYHQVLTVDLNDQRVGVNKDEPSHELDVDGTVNANNIENVSDARCKTNVESVTDGLDTVQQLRGVRFEWDKNGVADRDFDDDQHLGFLAQELESTIPEAVSTDEDGLRSTAYGSVTPVLVEAIKEQQEIIDQQEDLISRQKDTLETLEERVDQLERRIDSSSPEEAGTDGNQQPS